MVSVGYKSTQKQRKAGNKNKVKGIVDSMGTETIDFKFFKKYLTELENMLDKGGYKLLNKHLHNNDFKYNELVMDHIKVLGAWDFYFNSQRESIEQAGVKYFGTLTPNEFLKLSA